MEKERFRRVGLLGAMRGISESNGSALMAHAAAIQSTTPSELVDQLACAIAAIHIQAYRRDIQPYR